MGCMTASHLFCISSPYSRADGHCSNAAVHRTGTPYQFWLCLSIRPLSPEKTAKLVPNKTAESAEKRGKGRDDCHVVPGQGDTCPSLGTPSAGSGSMEICNLANKLPDYRLWQGRDSATSSRGRATLSERAVNIFFGGFGETRPTFWENKYLTQRHKDTKERELLCWRAASSSS